MNVAAVLELLADAGPASELRSQSPSIAALSLGFDRVLLTSVADGMLRAEALHLSDARRAAETLQRLRAEPVALEYPLVEGEIMRRRRAQLVGSADAGSRARHAFGSILDWTGYVTAPIILDGSVVGFLQADRQARGRELNEQDVGALQDFAACFALMYERAVLRHRLRVQLQDLRQVASWADARSGELGDRVITLSEGVLEHEPAPSPQAAADGGAGLRELLTRREIEVLRLIVAGETNVAIARDLVVSPGTVKFHVKNILRKLHASNRAEATSKYLRMTMNQR